MEKTPLSIRIIYVISRCMLICAAFFCLISIYLSVNIFRGQEMLNTNTVLSIPIISKTKEKGIVQFRGQDLNVTFVKAHAELEVSDAPKVVRWSGSIMIILWAFAVLYFIYLFYRLIRNVRDGRIFESTNFNVLRWLGWGIIIFGLISVIIEYFLKYTFNSDAILKTVSITPPSGKFWPMLIGGLFILTLAHIFQKGLELKAENELTI